MSAIPKNRSGVLFIDDEYGNIFPDQVPPEQADLIRHDRSAVVMNRTAAQTLHKKVGDRFTIISPQANAPTAPRTGRSGLRVSSRISPSFQDRSSRAIMLITTRNPCRWPNRAKSMKWIPWPPIRPEPRRWPSASTSCLPIPAIPPAARPRSRFSRKGFGDIDAEALTRKIAVDRAADDPAAHRQCRGAVGSRATDRVCHAQDPRLLEHRAGGTGDGGGGFALPAGRVVRRRPGAVAWRFIAVCHAARLPAFPPPTMTSGGVSVGLALRLRPGAGQHVPARPAPQPAGHRRGAFEMRMNTVRQIAVVVAAEFPQPAAARLAIAGHRGRDGMRQRRAAVDAGGDRRHAAGVSKPGDPRSLIIVSRGSIREDNSAIPRDQARIIINAPGIARAPDGSPLADSGFVTRPSGAAEEERRDGLCPADHLRQDGRGAAARLSSLWRDACSVPAPMN